MCHKFIRKILVHSIRNKIIKTEEKELYEFAYVAFVSQLITFMTILIVSMFFNVFWGTVLYILILFPLRIYAGGYHEDSYKKCYFSSVITYMFISILSETFINNFEWVLLISIIIIIKEAPQENKNKPFEDGEKTKFRKRTLLILLFAIIFCALLFVFEAPKLYLYYSLMGIVTVGALLILGIFIL